ncbi:hypothetical protein M9458_054903, partial [Cirrhinus mrigala]
KRRVSAAAGTAPPSKKKAASRSDEYSRMGETSLSKTVSVLSSEMAELKHLLQSLQPVTCASPVKTTQEDVNVQNQGAGEESLDSPCFSELGNLTATLLAARCQVWLAQARLPEDCKKTLRDLPFVPGHLFGPNVPELLEKRVKLSEATRQLTQVQRNPTFKIPAAQNRQRYATMDHCFRQHAAPQSQPNQRPCVTEDARVSRPPQRQLPGGPRQRPPMTSKDIQAGEYWKTNTADPWVLSTLSRGYTLQFSKIVPTVVRDTVCSLALSLKIRTCSLEIRTELVPEADDWFVSVDLKDAYFHVPIAVHHRKFLRFSFQNQAYQFKVLPFSLSLAPHVFTRCVSAALSSLWMRGMRILPYLDDWLLCTPTRQQAMQDSKLLLRHMQKLGFSVNETKSCLIPVQTTVFIGMTLNSCLMSASLSQERVTNILQLLAHFQPGVSLHYRMVLRLIGMLTAATVVIPLGLLHLRPLQLWNNSLRLISRHLHRLIVIFHNCIRALKRWRQEEFLKAGVPLGVVPSRQELVTTDASLTGWGATWNRRGICGRWTPIQAKEHINLLELRAVLMALRFFLPVLAGRHVLVRSDNTSTVFHLNHQGGTKSHRSLRLTHEILTWCQPRLASLRAAHISGVCNQTADALSRNRLHPGKWRLHPDVVREIWLRFGRAEVDLFASEKTTHCRLWASSTCQIYASRWELFSAWCEEHALNPATCDIPSVLRFFQRLLEEGKAAATLKVYVAAISAHHVPVEGSSLGSHKLVCSFLKGARRLKPARNPHFPLWDLPTVLLFLCSSQFEPLQSNDIKWICLLLLQNRL